MERIVEPAAMHARATAWRQAGRRIAFVPTMGALHEGHLALLRAARGLGDVLVLSIFVNPTQFHRPDDFRLYPRTLERDLSLAESVGVDCVFTPEAEAMYPAGHQTWVQPGPLAERLCGPFRPGHFRGVCTVVASLFHIVQPHVAVFGEKDFQQLQIIRRMVRDLHMPVEIVAHPTVRDRDGLACSSRNERLSPADRAAALVIPRALEAARALYEAGERRGLALRAAVARVIGAAPARPGGGQSVRLEYCHVCDPETLEDVDRVEGPVLVAVAAHVGSVRLIDNILLGRRS
ncbi:MAG TPA: pantoate--beta-alanine ligase [Thermodesulfobacteriota bacterium]|nr:pantoate--beta-alanine ligase [Thermodesulfobacteriota bacterium]